MEWQFYFSMQNYHYFVIYNIFHIDYCKMFLIVNMYFSEKYLEVSCDKIEGKNSEISFELKKKNLQIIYFFGTFKIYVKPKLT